jgi:hypothetical protein
MTSKENVADVRLLTIKNLNVDSVFTVEKIGQTTQEFKDIKKDATMTAKVLLLKGTVDKKPIVLKLYGDAQGVNSAGLPVVSKPIVAFTEVMNYIEENDLVLPAVCNISLTVIEDGVGQNTYKHFKELTNHIDINKAFGED